ncbi:MAG: amino acid permease [Legionella sp.]|nr:amino acid permease [Legionella sp.]
MGITNPGKRYFGIFQLVMIAIVSVDSLRNLPIGAQYGLSLVTFYLFAGIAFFFPLAWTASRLAVHFPHAGGSYLWVETAFGKSYGYLSMWLLWIYNVIWYPTIFAFISSIIASLIHPDLENSRWFMLLVCTSLFWFITFIHSYGIRTSARISTLCAIFGTLLPMFLMIILAAYWLLSGMPAATPLSWHALLPSAETTKDLAYFSNILFGLLGIEVIAMHSANVPFPKKAYPRALLISAPLILMSLALSSLALCIIVPPEQIKLLTGIMTIFELFFSAHHFQLGTQLVGWCIVIGGLGIASSWMIGLTRGIHIALSGTKSPHLLTRLNKNGVPMNILIFQGIIYTLLLGAFLLVPSVNSSYWLLSALTAQFALLYYVILFSAAIKLFRSRSSSPFQTFLGTLMPLSAGIVSLIGICVGFIPPTQIHSNHILQYELFMIGSILLFCFIPFYIIKKQNPNILM